MRNVRADSYSRLHQQSAMEAAQPHLYKANPANDEDEDVRAFLSFIPLLRFQTDKLFGVVALPVFYFIAGTLLVMNVLTFVLPLCGVRLVQPGTDLSHAMAGTWQTAMATALNLVVLHCYGRLRARVKTLVPESLHTKLRRCLCGEGDPPAESGNASVEHSGVTDWHKPSSEQTAATLRRLGSKHPSAQMLRTSSIASTSLTASLEVGVHPTADVYISHGEEPDDVSTAQHLKESVGTYASSWMSKEVMDREDAPEVWLIESHITEAMASCKAFVPLISEATLSSMTHAHEEWNQTLAEWDIALQLYNKGALAIVPAWVGTPDLGRVGHQTYSEQPPKGGKPAVEGEELFDTLHQRQRSVHAIVEEMLAYAEDSLRLQSTNAGTGVDGDRPKSLMLSYRVTETGDPADTKEKNNQGDNFTPKLQEALQARGYSCFVGEKQLEGGDEWATSIARAVKGCRAMLIVSSPTYGMTKWTFRELQMADNNQKKLIPIYHSGKFPPNEKVEVFLGGTQYIDFSQNHTRSFDDKVTELVAKLKKQKIFPDLHTSDGDSGGNRGSGEPRSSLQPEYDIEPLAAMLHERLEMAAMLDASDQSTSARSVQLWKLLDEELESSRDHKMRTAMQRGRGEISRTTKYLAWASTLLMYVFGPCAGVVAGMAIQQRMQHAGGENEAVIQWASEFGRIFITLRLWLFVVFISQFAVSLLFLTIQLFAVESHLNLLLAKRLSIMLGNPWEHFRRWDGTALATEFDAQYTLLTSTYENMSNDWQSMLTIGIGTSHAGAIAWIIHFFSFPDSGAICSKEAVHVLAIQLVFFYIISMAPFLAPGFCAPYSQSASSCLLAAVRQGSSERFDWVTGGDKEQSGGAGVKGRMQLVMYMKANPVAWKIFGVSITLVRGRCLAALVLMADAAFVWTGYWENGGMSESGSWALLWSNLSQPASGWGAYIYIVAALAVLSDSLIKRR